MDRTQTRAGNFIVVFLVERPPPFFLRWNTCRVSLSIAVMFSPSFRFALHWKYKVDNNTLVTQVANGIKITRLFNSEAVLNNLVPRAFPFWIGSATQFKREKPWERGCVLNRIWWKWLTFADGSSRLIKKIQREITAARTLLKRKEQEGWTGNEYLCLACFRVPRTNGSHFSRCLAASLPRTLC